MTMASTRAVWCRCLGARRVGIAGALLLGGAASAAIAQQQTTTLSLQSTVTATDNGGAKPDGEEEADLLLSVGPRLEISRRGAGLKLQSTLGADFVSSTRNTRKDRVLPLASLEAQSVLVDRLLYVDAGADVRQVEIDPFSSRVVDASTQNARTAGSARLSPYLRYEFSPRASVTARATRSRTRYKDTVTGDSDTQQGLLRVESRPVPLGGALEVSTERTDYPLTADSDVRIDRFQATANLAVAGDWVIGAMAGRERSILGENDDSGASYGLRLYWAPSPRTDLAATVDHRFFGNGWSITAQHRTPRIAMVLRTLREPLTAAYSLGGSGGASGLGGFLDAILTTRTPDPLERGALVDDVLASRGLQASLRGSIAPSATYAQLRTGHEATWVYLGPRNLLSLSLYAQELTQLQRDDGSVGIPVAATDDSRQYGLSFRWNRRLDTQTSLDLSSNWSRINGLELREGDRTKEGDVRASLVRSLSPRTNLSVGVSYRKLASNIANVNSFDESSGFLGLAHRF